MKNPTILCDNCSRDLSETGNSVDYRLALVNERMPRWDGAVTDMLLYPQIKQDAHFCGVGCLRIWLDKEHPDRRPKP